MDQPYAQPQFVMMPVPQRNGLGVFGFFVALIGLFIPTGVVALLGLILSLAAIGRAPRGFATFGVILGLFGTLFWLILMGVAVVLGILGVAVVAIACAGAFVLMQPEVVEVTTDMVNVAIVAEEYREDHSTLPDSIDALALGVAVSTDPWGGLYRLTRIDDDPGYDVISAGPDGDFDTSDDIRLTALDRLWEKALENFDERMEEFGKRMERLDRMNHRGVHVRFDKSDECDETTTYEEQAIQEIITERLHEVEETVSKSASSKNHDHDDDH